MRKIEQQRLEAIAATMEDCLQRLRDAEREAEAYEAAFRSRERELADLRAKVRALTQELVALEGDYTRAAEPLPDSPAPREVDEDRADDHATLCRHTYGPDWRE